MKKALNKKLKLWGVFSFFNINLTALRLRTNILLRAIFRSERNNVDLKNSLEIVKLYIPITLSLGFQLLQLSTHCSCLTALLRSRSASPVRGLPLSLSLSLYRESPSGLFIPPSHLLPSAFLATLRIHCHMNVSKSLWLRTRNWRKNFKFIHFRSAGKFCAIINQIMCNTINLGSFFSSRRTIGCYTVWLESLLTDANGKIKWHCFWRSVTRDFQFIFSLLLKNISDLHHGKHLSL